MSAASADDRGIRRIETVRERHDGAGHVAGVDPLQVDKQFHGLPCGIRVAVNAHARRRREFDVHARVGEGDRVEAGASALGAEVFCETPCARVGRVEVVRERQKANVGEIGATRAAQVGLREPVDARVFPHISGAVVPVAQPGVGTCLHHPERTRSPGERVPTIGSADLRVDEFSEVGRRDSRTCQSKTCEQ